MKTKKVASLRPSSSSLIVSHRNDHRRLRSWLTPIAVIAILLFMGEIACREEKQPLLKVQAFSPTVPKRTGCNTNILSSPANSGLTAATVDDDETMEESLLTAEDQGDNYHVPDDPLERHMLLLVGVTFPWYAFTAYEMMTGSNNDNFLGLEPVVVSTLGAYVVMSQLAVYFCCTRLARTTTLAKGQALVGVMTCLCVPADVIGTLYEPTGSLGVTVFAFATVTTAFGIFLTHYLRKAAYREVPPVGYQTIPNEEDENIGLLQEEEEEEESVWAVLQNYRPPPQPSSTKLAAEFTRAFVSFTISVSFLGTYFAEGHEPNFWICASLLSVLVHTSIESFLATVYPGIDLEEFDSYLIAESALYAIHMIATTIVSHEEGFGDTLVDRILWSWLFGSATGKLIDRMGKLLGKVDFDSKLGLSKFV